MNMKTKITFLMCSLFLSTLTINALQSVESLGEFGNALRKKDLVLAYFYKKPKDAPREVYELHKSINSMLKDADRQRYTPEFSEVYFIKTNISKPHLQKIADRFKIQRNNTFMIFDAGKRIATLNSYHASRASTRIIRDFIKENLESQIKEKMKRKEEEERRREEEYRRRSQERNYWYRNSWYPYYNGWYPYYGHYGHWGHSYGHGPHFGIGFSFH